MDIDLEKITERMDELKDVQARLKFELKQTEKEIEKYELQLQAVLTSSGVNEMQYGNYIFGWKEIRKKTFDQKLFSIDYPDLFNVYKTEKKSQTFDFKIAG